MASGRVPKTIMTLKDINPPGTAHAEYVAAAKTGYFLSIE
jgi:hypothetical protein